MKMGKGTKPGGLKRVADWLAGKERARALQPAQLPPCVVSSSRLKCPSFPHHTIFLPLPTCMALATSLAPILPPHLATTGHSGSAALAPAAPPGWPAL